MIMNSKQTIHNMRNGDLAHMYNTSQIHADASVTNSHGSIVGVSHIGKYIKIQAKKIESVQAYDDWLKKRNSFTRSKTKCTGAKLRRIVIMRRQGSTWKECADAVGTGASSVKKWVEFLPFELSI